ncbi:hypothetical protein BU25DRAFT_460097 [Macroventuria anomochaeta]|uniref:Uncharacterized protein n=1 Tax=Macroventuria anomochaeta TaxID=301207 RepID=A0ACB6RVE9_9PLEO|nr:uncharacterized protein BU25DRAFT_460097 [Macroventuria anomochaeta]KAF2625744.1 hypothetical protein BU25DRAFT_460097 [Macroventuria anomochaeta]
MPPHTQIPSTQSYPWPHDSTLSPSATALLIIDMKHNFLSPTDYLATLSAAASTANSTSPTSRFTPLLPIPTSLLSTFRHAHSPILHTREGHPPLCTISTRELHRSKISGAQIGTQGPRDASC